MRVDSTIEIPSRGWGDINGSSVGQIKSLSEMQQTGKMEVVVEFEEDKDWSGILDDIELSSTPSVGDQVQVWERANHSRPNWTPISSLLCKFEPFDSKLQYMIFLAKLVVKQLSALNRYADLWPERDCMTKDDHCRHKFGL